MTDHELLHPNSEPVHKQHLAADEDTDFICPGKLLPQRQKLLMYVYWLPQTASVSGQMLIPVRQCPLGILVSLSLRATVCIMM